MVKIGSETDITMVNKIIIIGNQSVDQSICFCFAEKSDTAAGG